MNKRWNKLCVSAFACVALVVPLTACEGQLPTPAADTSTQGCAGFDRGAGEEDSSEDSQDDR